MFAICDCDAHRVPQEIASDFRDVASDLRFRVVIYEPEPLLSAGFLATRKLLATAIVRFWCAKLECDRVERGFAAEPPGK